MPCKPIYDTDGRHIGFDCSRGRQPIERCTFCGKPMVNYCDVCDIPICSKHSHRVAFDTDVCPKHDNKIGIETAIKRRIEIN